MQQFNVTLFKLFVSNMTNSVSRLIITNPTKVNEINHGFVEIVYIIV